MAATKLIFYDIPTKTPRTGWSMNTWKIRLALNYMGIDYETEWIEYPDIKPKLENRVPPGNNFVPYTLPAVRFPDGTYMLESKDIAMALEDRYPSSPSLHLDSPYTERLSQRYVQGAREVRGTFFHRVPTCLLSEPSAEYFFRTRKGILGMTTEQFEREEGGEEAWQRASEGFRGISELYRENPDGPFLMGQTPCFADFIWIGLLVFFKKNGQDLFDKFLESTGDRDLHLKVLEAAEPWTKRDDH